MSKPHEPGMHYLETFYPESRFGGFTDLDATIKFYSRVHSLITPESVVLDVGCGRGAYAEDPVAIRREMRIFRGRCRRVIGLDIDAEAAGNPYLDEFHQLRNRRWPVDDESVDVCVSDWVLEHVEAPHAFFSECQRVVKPGGYLCLRTTNAHGYVAMLSRLIPNEYHPTLVSRIPGNKQAKDVFPAYYRCNTKGRISRMYTQYGFESCVYTNEAEPYYLSFNRFSYLLGVLHQRFAPSGVKLAIFAFGRRSERRVTGESML
jgi:ubiquinone/menaquinone biosynthesis C-methylase UbiE